MKQTVKITIEYTTNEQLWKMERIAKENGYEKTNDCYWCQLFENESGEIICTSREEVENPNAIEEFRNAVQSAESVDTVHKNYVNMETTESTTSATTAMRWHREGKRVAIWGWNPDGTQYHHAIAGAAPAEKPDENREHCKAIADDLDNYANGFAMRCPECGEIVTRPHNAGDKFKCPHCGNVADIDNYEWCDVSDFLSDVYDIEYRCGSDKEYRSVRIMVACGGPNIYIDTAEKAVLLYWWTDSARYYLSDDAVNAVDEWAEEYWGCM